MWKKFFIVWKNGIEELMNSRDTPFFHSVKNNSLVGLKNPTLTLSMYLYNLVLANCRYGNRASEFFPSTWRRVILTACVLRLKQPNCRFTQTVAWKKTTEKKKGLKLNLSSSSESSSNLALQKVIFSRIKQEVYPFNKTLSTVSGLKLLRISSRKLTTTKIPPTFVRYCRFTAIGSLNVLISNEYEPLDLFCLPSAFHRKPSIDCGPNSPTPVDNPAITLQLFGKVRNKIATNRHSVTLLKKNSETQIWR